MYKFLLLCFCCAAQPALAQQPDQLKQKALTLKRFMEKNHYQPLQWNDSASLRLYNKWIDFLDEEKLFFVKADIAVLEPHQTVLDEEMNAGNWQFFRKSADLYRKRLLKVDSVIKDILAKPLDFTVNESIEFPFKTYAADEAELKQRWKKYCKWRVLRSIADNGDTVALSATQFAAAEKKAVALQKQLEENYIKRLLNTSSAEFEKSLQESYLNSIAWCYDPHSTYMNMAKKDEFETMMSASEYSVGFDVEENDKGEPVVSYLQPGGSAWKNGQLHKGDVLVAIKIGNEFKPIADIKEDDLLEAMAGNNKNETELKFRTLTGETKIVKLPKEKVASEEEVVKSYVLQGNKNIGYINLPGFYTRENDDAQKLEDLTYDGSANDVSKEIVKLRKDSIAGLILDLRYNGGGSMWEAMQLAGIFIDIGVVASMKDKNGKVEFLKDPNRGSMYDGPLMVLINGVSASASEFIAAMLQDYNRAVIVGGTSYGKGTAQLVVPLDTAKVNPNKKYEDFVKVTEEKFYRVSGSTTQWKGVEPDIVLPDMYSSDEYKEKAEISALKPDMSKPGMYRPGPALPIEELKTKSTERTSKNDYFAAVNKYLQLTEQYEKGRTIPLTWAAYLPQYRLMKDLYNALIENKIASGAALQVRNNSLDKQRYSAESGYSKEANNEFLEKIANDAVLAEARAIMLDWIK